MPEKITVVPESAFENCSNLTKVTLPDNLLAIERKAFEGCDSLKEIVIPPHVSKVGTEAFPADTVICTSNARVSQFVWVSQEKYAGCL